MVPNTAPKAAEAANAARKGADQAAFLHGHLFWSLLSAIALTQFLGSDVTRELLESKTAAGALLVDPETHLLMPRFSRFEFAAVGAVFGAVIYAAGWLLRGRRRAGSIQT